MYGVAVKKCTHCGQEIPAKTPLCPFFHRAQPAAQVTPKRSAIGYANAGRLAALVFVALVGAIAGAVSYRTQKGKTPLQDTFEHRAKSALRVTSTRHPHGFEITNRESEPLAECVVRIPEQWSATIPKLAPSETATVTWAQFRNAAGAEMAQAIGQNARIAHFGCASHRETRSAAALRFR